jgi:hypothetical protein
MPIKTNNSQDSTSPVTITSAVYYNSTTPYLNKDWCEGTDVYDVEPLCEDDVQGEAPPIIFEHLLPPIPPVEPLENIPFPKPPHLQTYNPEEDIPF